MGTPVPAIGRDSQTKSDVITYTLSAEELAEYKQTGRIKPMASRLSITKEEYLQMRKSGKSRSQCVRALNTTSPTFYNLLGEWGIRELEVEEQLLLEMSSTTTGDKPVDTQPETPAETEAGGSPDGQTDSEVETGASRQSVKNEQESAVKTAEEELPAAVNQISIFQQIGLDVGTLVTEKNRAYGDSFAKCGEFLKLLYPNGVRPDQYGDMLTVVRVFDKLMRIATDKNALGENPWKDVCGYSILAQASALQGADTND